MRPQEWYSSLPLLTKAYFTGSLLVALWQQWRPHDAVYMPLNWSLVSSGEVWRVATNFFVWHSWLPISIYQIALLGHYSRCLELNYYRNHRGAFAYLLLLVLGASLIVATSLAWEDMHFGAPALLFFLLTVYARKAPYAESRFFGWTMTRQWLPFAHWCPFFLGQTNWMLATLGAALGYGVSKAIDFLYARGARLPESLLSLGDRLQLGEKSWQMGRTGGVAVGHADVSEWQ